MFEPTWDRVASSEPVGDTHLVHHYKDGSLVIVTVAEEREVVFVGPDLKGDLVRAILAGGNP